MKKTLAMILVLALVVGLAAGSTTAEAKAKYKTYILPEGLPVMSLASLVKDYFPNPDRMVLGLVNDGVDIITPFGGTLAFDKTVKYEEPSKVFGKGPIPEGTLAISLVVGNEVRLGVVTNIDTWESFKAHVIGLPEEFANGDEPTEPAPTTAPTLAPAPTSTPAPTYEEEKQKIIAPAMKVFAELEKALPEGIDLAYEVAAHNANAHRLKITVGKVVIYQLTHGADPDNPSSFFVENVRKEGRGFWEGYIGDVEAAAEYILSKTAPSKKK